MRKLIKIYNKVDTISIYWILTDLCNFKCSYCLNDLHSGEQAKQANLLKLEKEIDIFLDRIINEIVPHKRLDLMLSGGEPTLSPFYGKILEKMKPHGYVTTVSNGTRSLGWWKMLPALPSGIAFTLHPEWTKKIEQINEVSLYLRENGTKVVYNLMCDPNHWDKVLELEAAIDPSLRKMIRRKPVSTLVFNNGKQEYGHSVEYTDDQMAFIRTPDEIVLDPTKVAVYQDGNVITEETLNHFKVVAEKENEFKGWKCSVGQTMLKVTSARKVYAGICGSQYLGTITDFKLPTEWQTCPFDLCACPGDVYSPKQRIDN